MIVGMVAIVAAVFAFPAGMFYGLWLAKRDLRDVSERISEYTKPPLDVRKPW